MSLLVGAGCSFEEAPTSWIESFERALPCRLPPHFRSLITRYSFDPFEWRGILFFGNRGTGVATDLAVASVQDALLSRVMRLNGLLHIGRSAGSYDPVCFDMKRRLKSGDAPLVRVGHEDVLIHERVRVIRTYAKAFADFMAPEAA